MWRFDGDELVNKRFANWQFSTERWNWDDRNGWLMSKRKYYQLTRPNHGNDVSEGARLRLTTTQNHWEQWRKSRSITVPGDLNEWFTLYNVRSKRYLTAANAGSTQIQGQLSTYMIVIIPCYMIINHYKNLSICDFQRVFFSSYGSDRYNGSS